MCRNQWLISPHMTLDHTIANCTKSVANIQTLIIYHHVSKYMTRAFVMQSLVRSARSYMTASLLTQQSCARIHYSPFDGSHSWHHHESGHGGHECPSRCTQQRHQWPAHWRHRGCNSTSSARNSWKIPLDTWRQPDTCDHCSYWPNVIVFELSSGCPLPESPWQKSTWHAPAVFTSRVRFSSRPSRLGPRPRHSPYLTPKHTGSDADVGPGTIN